VSIQGFGVYVPRVNVLVLNFNYGRFLEEALNSVAKQTFADYEVIIADDGSTDETETVVGRFSWLISEFVTGQHVGLPLNLARGLERCNGEFVAFLSADDRWLPEHVRLGVGALDSAPQAALSYSQLHPISEIGDSIPPVPSLKKPYSPSGRVDPRELLTGNFIHTQACVIRRKVLDEVGLDTTLDFVENDLFIRVAARYPIISTGQTTVEYRVHDSSMSRNLDYMLACRFALYDKYLGHRPTKEKRRLMAASLMRAAHQEMGPQATSESLGSARRHILSALRHSPAVAWNRWNLALLLAAAGGRVFLALNGRYRQRFAGSRLKFHLHRVLGVGPRSAS
jgi:glycosyltransferase involved in cell wall biosynthesis